METAINDAVIQGYGLFDGENAIKMIFLAESFEKWVSHQAEQRPGI